MLSSWRTFANGLKLPAISIRSLVSMPAATTPSLSAVSVEHDGVSVKLANGGIQHLPSAWIMRSCQCSQCLQPSSGQRTHVPHLLTADSSIESAVLKDSGISVMWHGHAHTAVLPLSKLQKLFAPTSELEARTCTRLEVHDYSKIVDASADAALFNWLFSLAEDGAALVSGCHESSDNAVVENLANRISQPQPTIYGTTFDVESVSNPINIAYSNVGLGLHQDLIYYESAPGLQFLHCLEFPDSTTGGESILMDGFAIAERLQTFYPDEFQTLTEIPMLFEKVHYTRALPVHIQTTKPIIRTCGEQRVCEVNWAPPFEGIQRPLSPGTEKRFLRAYQAFAALMEESTDLLLTHRLHPGETLTFNNRRMLHGRTAFELGSSSEKRHLKGIYINIDEFSSRFCSLAAQRLGHAPAVRVGNGKANVC